MAPAPFKRAGLHKLACACGGYAYSTVSQLETVGSPRCACGGELFPDRLELAMLLGLEDAPVVAEYYAAVQSAARGQAPMAMSGRHAARSSSWRTPETIAADRLERDRVASARKRRLGALLPAPEAMPF